MVFSGLESAGSKCTVFLYSCFAPGSNSFFDLFYFEASIQTDGRGIVAGDFPFGIGWKFRKNRLVTI